MVVDGFHFKIFLLIVFLYNVNASVIRRDVTRTTSTKNLLLDLLDGRHQNLIVILDAGVLSPKTEDDDEDVEVDTGVRTFDENEDESDDDWLENNESKDSLYWLHHLLRSSDDDQSNGIDSKLYLRAALRKRCVNLNKCKKKCPEKKKPCIQICVTLIDKENLCDDKPKKCDKCGKKKCDECGKYKETKCDKCGKKKCHSECEIFDFDKYWNEF